VSLLFFTDIVWCFAEDEYQNPCLLVYARQFLIQFDPELVVGPHPLAVPDDHQQWRQRAKPLYKSLFPSRFHRADQADNLRLLSRQLCWRHVVHSIPPGGL
jgi:hypothetical protein